ncbi:MAG: 1-deoxy-D-xylulose-5-phosphate reductoisomerase [Pseudomonadota bacterium]
MTKRRISIFGATGSIGQNTIDLVRRAPDMFHTVALTGAGNVELLASDARELCAEIVVTADPQKYQDLKDLLAGSDIEVAAGHAGLIEAANRPADWVMSAIVGAAGLAPGIEALRQGATLALANKETLVCAGKLVLETAKSHAAQLLPVDSEHSAVFQALIGEDIRAVERVIITASGGAFRDWPLERLADATPEQAACHPNWDMGQRITIDSASMFNKALELIETHEFFPVTPEQIEVLVHPESLIHAMVGFRDGGIIAHVGPPDMRHAIGFALNYPERADLPVDRLDLAALGQFSFHAPDEKRWPALRMAREVMERGGLSGAVFNAAKETALDGFLQRKIGFLGMAEVVETVLSDEKAIDGLIDAQMTLDNVYEADHLARQAANVAITKLAAG